MRLIILKINNDVINGGVASAIIGIFDRDGRKSMEFFVPGRLFAKDFNYEEGKELILKPAEQF